MNHIRNATLSLLFSLFFVGTSMAAEVRVLNVDTTHNEVSLSFDPKVRWVPSDRLCLFSEGKSTVCGEITSITKDYLKVKVEEGQLKLDRGTLVSLRKMTRPLASLTSTELVERGVDRSHHDIALGVAAGFNYFFPTLHLQQRLDNDFAIGLMPLYLNFNVDNAGVKAWGGFATISYYYTHSPFRGFYGQAGVGFYSISANAGTVSESHTQMSFLGTVNWRGRASWELGLDIGVSAGLQYVLPAQNSLVSSFSGVLPILMVSLGYPF